jgi:HEPN domain-containing protein
MLRYIGVELAFYGDIDFIPTEEYTKDDAEEAIRDARFVVDTTRKLIQG